MSDLENLIGEARRVRDLAHAPYSAYHVGSALRSSDGRVFAGCNVENVSYGATICAERSAIARMVAEGAREIAELVVLTKDGGSPCGVCRQVMAEFAPDPSRVKIHLVDEAGTVKTLSLSDLFPFPFASDAVERTER